MHKHTLALLALVALAGCEDLCADEDGDGAVVSAECKDDLPLDCDDDDAAVHPDAAEVCDGVDNDCDGDVDGGAVDAVMSWDDADGDGFGDAEAATEACEVPSGYVEDDTDCDDGDAEVNPDAVESCNGIDDDCDALVDDEDEDVVDTVLVYPDADGDGYGEDGADGYEVCEVGANESLEDGDCDDTDASQNPGAEDICGNGIDDDCDGEVDEGCEEVGWEGTWSAAEATIRLSAKGEAFDCVGDVVVDIDADGGILGEDLSCLLLGHKALYYDVSGAVTTAPYSDGVVDFADAGGPAYDFEGEFLDQDTLSVRVDQTLSGVRCQVSWTLTRE